MVAGTFIVSLSTYAVLYFTGRFDYLILAAFSTTSMTLIGVGLRPTLLGEQYFAHTSPIMLFVAAGAAVLAAQATIVTGIYYDASSILYASVFSTGCLLTIWGNANFFSRRAPPRKTESIEAMIPS